MDGITAGFMKFKELVKGARAFKMEDQVTFVGFMNASCSQKSKLVDAVLDEVYKYGESFNLTILVLSEDKSRELGSNLGDDITQELLKNLQKEARQRA
ncbi:hypothetical protein GWK48_08120 [Metallosphaera tengchongensis]|uniref:Uncharacterized protein n=1 Tax=Metallosphaera tengchongensis TaxID=1532350 RepID=A0A6N0NWU4_9CREN|nr:hypothetical protein [Metallosphaera tengchongensis]QKR00343.1 hypothetical protein GWK48_08120 [Metallosphaera tengchongensis]